MNRNHFYSDVLASVLDKLCYAAALLETIRGGQRKTYWD